MSSELFRKEVLAAKRSEWLGSIRLQPPSLGWLYSGLALLTIIAVLILFFFGHYTRHEQIDGTIVPSSGLLTLTPVSPGTLTKVMVREGDIVHSGQPLLEISGEQDSVALGSTQEAIATELQFKRDRLLEDLAEQSHLAKLQEKDLRSQLALLREQIAQMNQQILLQKQRADSANDLFEQWSKLGNTGVISKLQLLQQHDTALQDLAQLKELKGQYFQLQQQAEQLQGQLNQLPTTILSKHNDTERQLADITQSLSQNAVQRALLLRAPSDGTIVSVLVHLGQSVTAQQSLLTILPARSKLLAELWASSEAIGSIHAGESVVIHYHAFPYQTFGQHYGRVREVSQSAVLPSVINRLTGQSISEPRYRVEVTLDSQEIFGRGQMHALKPGMTLDANILLNRQRLIEWVIEPLRNFRETMRDNNQTAGSP